MGSAEPTPSVSGQWSLRAGTGSAAKARVPFGLLKGSGEARRGGAGRGGAGRSRHARVKRGCAMPSAERAPARGPKADLSNLDDVYETPRGFALGAHLDAAVDGRGRAQGLGGEEASGSSIWSAGGGAGRPRPAYGAGGLGALMVPTSEVRRPGGKGGGGDGAGRGGQRMSTNGAWKMQTSGSRKHLLSTSLNYEREMPVHLRPSPTYKAPYDWSLPTDEEVLSLRRQGETMGGESSRTPRAAPTTTGAAVLEGFRATKRSQFLGKFLQNQASQTNVSELLHLDEMRHELLTTRNEMEHVKREIRHREEAARLQIGNVLQDELIEVEKAHRAKNAYYQQLTQQRVEAVRSASDARLHNLAISVKAERDATVARVQEDMIAEMERVANRAQKEIQGLKRLVRTREAQVDGFQRETAGLVFALAKLQALQASSPDEDKATITRLGEELKTSLDISHQNKARSDELEAKVKELKKENDRLSEENHQLKTAADAYDVNIHKLKQDSAKALEAERQRVDLVEAQTMHGVHEMEKKLSDAQEEVRKTIAVIEVNTRTYLADRAQLEAHVSRLQNEIGMHERTIAELQIRLSSAQSQGFVEGQDALGRDSDAERPERAAQLKRHEHLHKTPSFKQRPSSVATTDAAHHAARQPISPNFLQFTAVADPRR